MSTLIFKKEFNFQHEDFNIPVEGIIELTEMSKIKVFDSGEYYRTSKIDDGEEEIEIELEPKKSYEISIQSHYDFTADYEIPILNSSTTIEELLENSGCNFIYIKK